ncbi:type IV pilus modification protein PilV [Pseudomonas alcaligenes]|uniref:Type IV pilus modification protein PilV n=1 Tax=Aquipseudomonas alcaligenes TaxID=43263 RepID=A0ABR7S696_AQUAC|nr:type IV pilus modification protein PilV [Pseudomonas alcaligenes]MBC9252242.1 type IV pilus modification protein PilV [Pseudomonas alcaligenes]
MRKTQLGVTLIEVMIAVFISAIGVLGAAALQLNALKYTNSAVYTSQASFIAYDILDRIRANADPDNLDDYELDSTDTPSGATGLQGTDLTDFAANVHTLPSGEGSIGVVGSSVTVTISWSEGKAGTSADDTGTFTVTTDVANE